MWPILNPVIVKYWKKTGGIQLSPLEIQLFFVGVNADYPLKFSHNKGATGDLIPKPDPSIVTLAPSSQEPEEEPIIGAAETKLSDNNNNNNNNTKTYKYTLTKEITETII